MLKLDRQAHCFPVAFGEPNPELHHTLGHGAASRRKKGLRQRSINPYRRPQITVRDSLLQPYLEKRLIYPADLATQERRYVVELLLGGRLMLGWRPTRHRRLGRRFRNRLVPVTREAGGDPLEQAGRTLRLA
ncbi:MAG: hypothetical protein OET79_16300 [Nitrospirota bacterium]|nr:hypothetical protein [Nitrospirota bacterium]